MKRSSVCAPEVGASREYVLNETPAKVLKSNVSHVFTLETIPPVNEWDIRMETTRENGKDKHTIKMLINGKPPLIRFPVQPVVFPVKRFKDANGVETGSMATMSIRCNDAMCELFDAVNTRVLDVLTQHSLQVLDEEYERSVLKAMMTSLKRVKKDRLNPGKIYAPRFEVKVDDDENSKYPVKMFLRSGNTVRPALLTELETHDDAIIVARLSFWAIKPNKWGVCAYLTNCMFTKNQQKSDPLAIFGDETLTLSNNIEPNESNGQLETNDDPYNDM